MTYENISAGDHKYTEAVCPSMEALQMSPITNMNYSVCVDDSGCTGDKVCCSNGVARVCADPVGKLT